MIHRIKSLWSFSILFILFTTQLQAQLDSLNVKKIGNLPFQSALNDVWGYADSLGNEWALVGRVDGFSVVDISNPTSPAEVLDIPGTHSVWRDVKTWKNYAYVTHDIPDPNTPIPSQGLLIVNLDSLQNPTFKFVQFELNIAGMPDTFLTAHNLYIDENGVCYLFGSNIGVGGALMFDLTKDPWNPTYLGIFNDHYLHDGMARGDTLWGGAIYAGSMLAIDVSNKTNPQILGQKQTPNQFTHNCWISDDGKTVFTTDERPDSYVAAYDVSDMNNITELDRIQSLPDSNIIPHNVHVYGDFLVTSYYTTGVQIVDAAYPNNLVESGYYDTYPSNNGPTYQGNWGAYPYLPSGNILATDRAFGLYILEANYKRASRIMGEVRDSLTKQVLFNTDFYLSVADDSLISDLNGEYIYGTMATGWDTIILNWPGYYPYKEAISLNSGVNNHHDIVLIPLVIGQAEMDQQKQVELFPNPTVDVLNLKFEDAYVGQNVELTLYHLDGRIAYATTIEVEHLNQVNMNLPNGSYILQLLRNNEVLLYQKLTVVKD